MHDLGARMRATVQLGSTEGAHGIADCTGLHVFADYSSALSFFSNSGDLPLFPRFVP